MCTALRLQFHDSYFGRTLDIDRSYGEELCIVPRALPLSFRTGATQMTHYAMIGMACVAGGVPLFYDAANEHGLAMAGLNFPQNACYHPMQEGKDNIAPFELIPWILGQCKTVGEAKAVLERLSLVNIPFSEQLPQAPLHWMISDGWESLVVESMQDGLHVYDDPIGVMTNNPPFDFQLFHLNQYRHIRVDTPENHFADSLPLTVYCQGLGGLGLPGDVSSMSRFVRAAFGRAHALCDGGESAAVSQFFHVLGSVEMIRGVCRTDHGTWDYTLYTSCINLTRGLYYYTTYDNHRIQCVDLHRADLGGQALLRYPLVTTEQVAYLN